MGNEYLPGFELVLWSVSLTVHSTFEKQEGLGKGTRFY